MQITALIPYFGGSSSAAPSKADNRPGYLLKTIASLEGFALDDLVVGLHVDDTNVPDIDCSTIRIAGEPRFLPANLMRWGQANVASDYVYVTEADQVLQYNPAVLNFVEGVNYLVPHRLEQIGPKGGGADRGLNVTWDNRPWCLPAGTPPATESLVHLAIGSPYYFGGGFLATKELFLSTNFIDSANSPVEHATGFNIATHGCPLKATAWQDFFVEHMSGYEYHQKLDGTFVLVSVIVRLGRILKIGGPI